jgi:hypothetical protein
MPELLDNVSPNGCPRASTRVVTVQVDSGLKYLVGSLNT